MRILGIDPGSTVTGFGVIDAEQGRIKVVAAGALNLGRSRQLADRLLKGADGIRGVIRQHSPDDACLERVFAHINIHSALVLAHLRGALLLELSRAGLRINEYTALQVKKALVGHGHAGKEQVRSMVQRLLSMQSAPRPLDISDALAVAICHAHCSTTVRRWSKG